MHINYNLPKKILAWYDNNKRSLPWRVGKSSPKKLYYRLLSEFMLQQTQVKTVVSYFEKFKKELPDLKSLSNCTEDKILKMWEGLGYYRRARNLLATSKILVKEKKNKLPKDLHEIKKLPGVGEYTGNIMLALIHNKPTIAIDGNVKRVFARVVDKFEDEVNFNLLIEKNKKNLFNTGRNSDLAEAIMEFGALICIPKKPKCFKCNLTSFCKSFKSKKFNKIKKKKIFLTKSYDIFCYLSKEKKQIALTKKNKLGFLNTFNLPKIKNSKERRSYKSWKFLCNYKKLVSNKKLNINLYYKFSKKIPGEFNWHSIQNNKDFIPSFTKKIFKQVSHLY